MGQVYLQSFLVLPLCMLHEQLWGPWKLMERLRIHWGPSLAQLGGISLQNKKGETDWVEH